jgi:hypothetical protein
LPFNYFYCERKLHAIVYGNWGESRLFKLSAAGTLDVQCGRQSVRRSSGGRCGRTHTKTGWIGSYPASTSVAVNQHRLKLIYKVWMPI